MQKDVHLQIRYRCDRREWILPEQSLLIKELSSAPVKGREVEAIVKHIGQALCQSDQNSLLTNPHWSLKVQSQAFLKTHITNSSYSYSSFAFISGFMHILLYRLTETRLGDIYQDILQAPRLKVTGLHELTAAPWL